MRASFNVLGPLLARCGEARVALPGRRQHREPQGRHAPARPRGDGRRGGGRPRLRARALRRAAGRARRARVPERRRDREPHVRGGARQGHDGDRERGARARGHRPRRVPRSHGRAGDRRGHRRRSRSKASRSSCPPTARSWPTASRPERCSWRAASRAARSSSSGRGSSTSRSSCRSCARWACACRRRPTGCGRAATSRLRAIDVATLPHPGFATDFMPIAVALHVGGRGQRDRHREHLRRPVPVRRRARPHGRRRAHRGPPRDRPGRRAAVGRAGARPPTCGPAPRSCSPASWPRARRSCTAGEHVDRGYPDLPATLRSLGADVERDLTAVPRDRICRDCSAGTPAILGAFTASSPDQEPACRSISPPPTNAILEAIDAIRPALQSDGGDIVYQGVDPDGVVHVTLVGACGSCPVSTMTLKAGVERIIMDRVPGVTEVVADE